MAKEKEGRQPLTDAQAECYNALVFYIKEHGYPPSLQELADILGKAKTTVATIVKYLDDKGWVERSEEIARGTIPVGYRYGIRYIEEEAPDNPYSF